VSEVIRVLVVIAVIGYVIGRQLMGEPLRGKRVVLLPLILGVAGAADLGTHGRHVRPADAVCLVISGLIAVTIGHPPQPPAGDADPAGHPGTGQGGYVPRGGGAATDLATLARLAGEWLAARRERGR
jgi:hypothetical protein